jgi:hypothetical protein
MLRRIFFLLLISLAAQAQNELDLENLFSNDKKFFRMAIDSSICIVRQDYVMKSVSGNEYGRSGKGYFGRRYALGVVADHKVWTLANMATPWVNDRTFEQYKKNDTIQPHLATVAFRSLVSTDYQKEENPQLEKYDSSGVINYRVENQASVNSFLNTKDGSGWLVVVSAREDLATNEKSPLNVAVYTPNAIFQNTERETLLKRLTLKDNVIGGVYFVATVRAGVVRYHAAGILTNKNKEWYIVRLPQLTHRESPPADELTPLKGKQPTPVSKKGTETPTLPANETHIDKEPVNKKREGKKKETKQNESSTLPSNNY